MKTLTTLLLALILAAAMTCPAWAQTKRDTAGLRNYVEFEAKRNDTAKYWMKDISDQYNGSYTTTLLPARDTVSCYFEYITGDTTIPGRAINTQWIFGFATRYHERITGFMYRKGLRAPVTVLNYKIIP